MSAAEALYMNGRRLEASGEFADAISCYRAALDADPEFISAHVSIQYIHEKPGNSIPDLIDFYETLLSGKDLKCSNLIYSNIGYLYSDLGDAPRAIAAFRRSSRITLKKKGLHAALCASCKPSVPDFIIAGFSKCGTTSAYLYLRRHPQVICGPRKEISFFNNYYDLGLAWYTAQMFRPHDSGYITGEATPQYASERGIELRIAALPRIPKIIMLLRDPSLRAISHYYQKYRSGLESRSLVEAVTWEMAMVDSYGPKAMENLGISYVNRSMYRHHLARWEKVIPPNYLLVVESERFFDSPAQTIAKICDFLGITVFELESYPIWNKGEYPRPDNSLVSKLRKFFARHGEGYER